MSRRFFQSSTVVSLTFLRTNVLNVHVKNQCDHDHGMYRKEDRMQVIIKIHRRPYYLFN